MSICYQKLPVMKCARQDVRGPLFPLSFVTAPDRSLQLRFIHIIDLLSQLLKENNYIIFIYTYICFYILLSDFYRPWDVKNIHPICVGLVGVERVILRMPVFALSLAAYTCISCFDYIHVQSCMVVVQRAPLI